MTDTLLLIDKSVDFTSHDVVNCVRKIFNTRHVGHAGTLDPFATGLLILGVGKATKELTALVGLDKTYEATAMLGATTTTFDTEGEITIMDPRLREDDIKIEDIERAFNQFRGGYTQLAPIFSAKKIKGKKLYELARAGKATEEMRPSKLVDIKELAIIDYSWPVLRFRVVCSSGTYIRSLADDIGRVLGCGAYLTALRRLKIGEYDVKDAKTLDQLKPLDEPTGN